MSLKTLKMTDKLYRYLLKIIPKQNPILNALRKETLLLKEAEMMTSPEQMAFFQFLLYILQPTAILEIGTFTGYATLAMALATPPDCKIITCDIFEKWPAIGEVFWQKANVNSKIEVNIGPALNTLQTLKQRTLRFDFIFIDADKSNSWNYLTESLHILKPKGIIAIDNTLWKGKVADKSITDHQTEVIRVLNARLAELRNVIYSVIPIGDGLTLVSTK